MNLTEYVEQGKQFHKQSLLIFRTMETYLACNGRILKFLKLRSSRKAPTVEPKRRVYSHWQATVKSPGMLSLTTVFVCHDTFPTYMATKVMFLTKYLFPRTSEIKVNQKNFAVKKFEKNILLPLLLRSSLVCILVLKITSYSINYENYIHC